MDNFEGHAFRAKAYGQGEPDWGIGYGGRTSHNPIAVAIT